MLFIIFFVALIIIGKICEGLADIIGYLCISIGLAGLIICLVIIFNNNIGVNEKIYNAHLDRESIVQQLECVTSNYENVSKAAVIDKVYQWNKEVHFVKYWSQNPWTNWFWNKEYVYSLKYIDMGD